MYERQIQRNFLIILSAFCFALMNTFVRLAGDLPSIQKSFFRNFIAAIFAAVMIVKSGTSFRWNKGNLPDLLVRAIAGTVGILCNFYAVDHLVLSDASMLNKMSPFFVIIFSRCLPRFSSCHKADILEYGSACIFSRFSRRTRCRSCIYVCPQARNKG